MIELADKVLNGNPRDRFRLSRQVQSFASLDRLMDSAAKVSFARFAPGVFIDDVNAAIFDDVVMIAVIIMGVRASSISTLSASSIINTSSRNVGAEGADGSSRLAMD
jgi:hypothetical protein